MTTPDFGELVTAAAKEAERLLRQFILLRVIYKRSDGPPGIAVMGLFDTRNDAMIYAEMRSPIGAWTADGRGRSKSENLPVTGDQVMFYIVQEVHETSPDI